MSLSVRYERADGAMSLDGGHISRCAGSRTPDTWWFVELGGGRKKADRTPDTGLIPSAMTFGLET